MDNTVTKTYRGTQEKAIALFHADAEVMRAQGYDAIDKDWVPGSYGCGSFLLALLLFFACVGIFIFIYMLFVKPPGKLMVTYRLRS